MWGEFTKPTLNIDKTSTIRFQFLVFVYLPDIKLIMWNKKEEKNQRHECLPKNGTIPLITKIDFNAYFKVILPLNESI